MKSLIAGIREFWNAFLMELADADDSEVNAQMYDDLARSWGEGFRR